MTGDPFYIGVPARLQISRFCGPGDRWPSESTKSVYKSTRRLYHRQKVIVPKILIWVSLYRFFRGKLSAYSDKSIHQSLQCYFVPQPYGFQSLETLSRSKFTNKWGDLRYISKRATLP